MNSFREKFMRFMYGRNGIDPLSIALIVIHLALIFLNTVFRFGLPQLIFSLVGLLCLTAAIFRTLSKNLGARQRENANFLRFWDRVKSGFGSVKNSADTARDRATDVNHKYIKCKKCGAQLRVKRQKGKHTVKCPKCSGSFSVKI